MGDAAAPNEWEAVAGAWERRRDWVFESFRSSSDWLIDTIDPQPGETILEVAAGPGETGFAVAERVGSEGKVISTDLAPTMVEAARRGARARNLDNVECRVMDAQRLELDDGAVDAAISRLGFMLVPDPAAAFAELRRVVRGGGRVAYTVIGAPDRNAWMGMMMGALVQAGHPPPGGDPFSIGGPFGLASPETNVQLLEAAGFEHVEAGAIDGTVAFDGVDGFWDVHRTMSGPAKAAIDLMDADQQEELRGSIEAMLTPMVVDGTLELSSQVVAVRAS